MNSFEKGKNKACFTRHCEPSIHYIHPLPATTLKFITTELLLTCQTELSAGKIAQLLIRHAGLAEDSSLVPSPEPHN